MDSRSAVRQKLGHGGGPPRVWRWALDGGYVPLGIHFGGVEEDRRRAGTKSARLADSKGKGWWGIAGRWGGRCLVQRLVERSRCAVKERCQGDRAFDQQLQGHKPATTVEATARHALVAARCLLSLASATQRALCLTSDSCPLTPTMLPPCLVGACT